MNQKTKKLSKILLCFAFVVVMLTQSVTQVIYAEKYCYPKPWLMKLFAIIMIIPEQLSPSDALREIIRKRCTSLHETHRMI